MVKCASGIKQFKQVLNSLNFKNFNVTNAIALAFSSINFK